MSRVNLRSKSRKKEEVENHMKLLHKVGVLILNNLSKLDIAEIILLEEAIQIHFKIAARVQCKRAVYNNQ